MVAKRMGTGDSQPRRPPATTPEGRELVLQAKAFDLVERRLDEGTASATETVYLLRTANQRDKLEIERLRQENLLTEQKVEQLKGSRDQDALLSKAMRAFTEYRGDDPSEDDHDD